jgi:hypothetical protein
MLALSSDCAAAATEGFLQRAESVDNERSGFGWRLGAAVLLVLVSSILYAPGARRVAAENGGYSLRFYGHGVDGIDRVQIHIDPPVPADVGATDFTIEWWMKALPGENSSSACISGGDNWIYGNILFDRDIWGEGDYGDYGVSLAGGRIAFGVNNGSGGYTLCGAANVADGSWHHIAVTRRRSDGWLRIFVDGLLDAEGNGPPGDVSYRDGRATGYANDPWLVIGAEKHDAGPAYPSYSGWVDEVRLSNALRYTSNFVPPSSPFTSDGNTIALYHLDEGPAGACSGTIVDSSGARDGPSSGTCSYGGSNPAGPVYISDSPFAQDTIPPAIDNVTASALDTWALIAWSTDEVATSQVTYGISPTLSISTTEVPSYTLAHTVVLTGLSPSTTYVYVVRSRDEAGNASVSGEHGFATVPTEETRSLYLPLVLSSPLSAAAVAHPSEPLAQLYKHFLGVLSR